MKIIELPLRAPQHDASPEEERVAQKAVRQGRQLAQYDADYVVCDERATAVWFRGTLAEADKWLDEEAEALLAGKAS